MKGDTCRREGGREGAKEEKGQRGGGGEGVKGGGKGRER